MVNKQKIICFILILHIILLSSLINCGDAVIDEVTGFDANPGPIYKEIDIKYANQQPFILGSYLLPNMLLYITVEVNGDIVNIFYSADIPGNVDTGSFNNKLITRKGEQTYIGTTTYALPGSLVSNSTVSITITVEDIKGAFSTKELVLGPVKPAPITYYDTCGITDNYISVSWRSDADGLFQFYTIDDNSIDRNLFNGCRINTETLNECTNIQKGDEGSCQYCTLDLSISPVIYKYDKEVIIKYTPSNFATGDDVFCIVIYDGLGQFSCLEYYLH